MVCAAFIQYGIHARMIFDHGLPYHLRALVFPLAVPQPELRDPLVEIIQP